MKKILLINAWAEFDQALDYVQKGGTLYPLDHFWAYDSFHYSGRYQIDLLKYNPNSLINRLGNWLKIENLQQQIDCFRRQKEYDAVFDPFMEHCFVLALLKSAGLFRKPLFALSQRALVVNGGNPLKSLREFAGRFIYSKGIDYIYFINQSLYEKNEEFPIRSRSGYARHWGVDVAFFDRFRNAQTEPPSLGYVLVTGGTARDFPTLIRAFEGQDVCLKVIPKKAMDYPKGCPVLPNVKIDNSLPMGLESTGVLRREYYHAMAVAIPLLKTRWFGTFGATVLFEAMAMGKPVITTRNPAYPLDVEKEKIGIALDYGDVQGWRQAIKYLKDHPEEAREMGERGRLLCKKKYNYQLFSEEIVSKFKEIIF